MGGAQCTKNIWSEGLLPGQTRRVALILELRELHQKCAKEHAPSNYFSALRLFATTNRRDTKSSEMKNKPQNIGYLKVGNKILTSSWGCGSELSHTRSMGTWNVFRFLQNQITCNWIIKAKVTKKTNNHAFEIGVLTTDKHWLYLRLHWEQSNYIR